MKKNNKGFTMAELLIVVAIIAVLVAISIPVFIGQLERSREATDMANARNAYASAVTSYLGDQETATASFEATQLTAGWDNEDGIISSSIKLGSDEVAVQVQLPDCEKGDTVNITVEADGDSIKVTAEVAE